MNYFKNSIFIIFLCSLTSAIYSQPRNAGRLVVPRGYENYDSVRAGLFSIDDAEIQWQDSALTNREADSLMCTAEYTYTGLLSTTNHLFGKRKQVMTADSLSEPTRLFKQSYFYALPFIIPQGNTQNSSPYYNQNTQSFSFFWKYNTANFDPIHARYFNNTYDANDISPYSEFDAQHDSVIATYHTSRWLNGTNSIVDSVLDYGDEGRPILACSSPRIADALLRVEPNGVCPPLKPAYWWTGNSDNLTNKSIITEIVDTASYPSLAAYRSSVFERGGYDSSALPALDTMVFEALGSVADTARDFSTTLDFNIDTSNIDTSNSNGRSIDSLPLLRFQVLFKMGDTANLPLTGWPLQPFTPFRDSTHSNPAGAGWYKVTDVVITRATYRKLDNCWKYEDQLGNGSASHSWTFKQLHTLFQDVPQSLRNLMVSNSSDISSEWDKWAHNTDALADSSAMLPDSITTPPNDSILPAVLHIANPNLLEIRVLSTFRAKVRVRGLALEDTNVDKFLYRLRISGDSTHSLNPLPDGAGNSVIGGYDNNIAGLCSRIKAQGGAAEYLEIDVNTALNGNLWYLSFPMFGYMDYMAGKDSMAPHIHEQGGSGAILDFRRNRIMFDDEPPSMYEDIAFGIGGGTLFPRDYVVNTTPTAFESDTILAPLYSVDTGFISFHIPAPYYKVLGNNDPWEGMFVMRDTLIGGDSLLSYKAYTNQIRGLTGAGLREMALQGLNHPNARRMPYEASFMFGWLNLRWYWRPDTGTEYVYYGGSLLGSHPYPSTPVTDTGYMLSTAKEPITGLPLSWGLLHDSVVSNDTSYSRYYAGIRWHDTDTCGYSTRPPTPEEFQGQVFVALASGASSFAHQQPLGAPAPDESGYDGVKWYSYSNSPALWGIGKKVLTDSFYRTGYPVNHFQNFGHEGAPGWPSEWSMFWTNDPTGNLPDYYFGYSNSWREWRRTIGRINEIYDSTNGRIVAHPLRYMKWLNGYSNGRCANPSSQLENNDAPGWDAYFRYPMSTTDSLTKVASFVKVTQTIPVDPWHRNTDGSYEVLSSPDADTASYVEVGLFQDSINTTQKNYAALVVNTRTYPAHDPVDSAYFNQGLSNAQDRSASLLGDIDVRKIYLKLDLTKTDPTFGGWTYYIVRDLWHSDSTWLLHRDSTFAIYIKPGDAKFLYFEPGIAVNASAQTGTNVGHSTQAEFGFNNGRRVAEIEHGTRSVVTYTKHHKLFVSYPAAGETFGTSPDHSAGDNIITGFEEPIDTLSSHFIARPSISPASNDTGIAIAYWYEDSLNDGHVAAAYQSSPGSTWQIAVFSSMLLPFNDTTSDNHWVTPVITPINDTAWLIAAGTHSGLVPGSITGLYFFTPETGSPYFKAVGFPMVLDTIIDDTLCRALYPTLSSRPIADSLWPVRFAYQRPTTPEHHEIYYTRFQQLMGSREQDSISDASFNLAACDNVHPSLALGGVEQLEGIHQKFPHPILLIDSQCYDDHLAWEAKLDLPSINTGRNYWPVIHARHEAVYPNHIEGVWGGYSVEQLDTGANFFHYPNVATEPRFWDYTHWYQQGNNNLYDFIRMGFQEKGMVSFLEWAPNWFSTLVPQPYGFGPSLAQSATPMTNWTDSSMVPRSFVMLPSSSDTGLQNMMITNGWLNGINWWTSFLNPNVILLGPQIGVSKCTGIIGDVSIQQGHTVPNNPSHQVQILAFAPLNATMYGMDDDWPVPSRGTNEVHTNNFAINACDSIVIPRAVSGMDFTAIQDALTTSDTLVFRMTLRNSVDSSYLCTVDSMSITKSTIYWAGSIGSTINSETASYQVSCSLPSDSAFVMVEVLRSDITDSLKRAYVEVQDTLGTPPPAPKQADGSPSNANINNLVVTVHPNPASSSVKICVEDLPQGIPVVVNVVNQTGVSVATLYNATPEAELGLCLSLDCSRLPSGIYYAALQTEGMQQAVKFVVEH
jgi:hypothetical protein